MQKMFARKCREKNLLKVTESNFDVLQDASPIRMVQYTKYNITVIMHGTSVHCNPA